eukprot:4286317-Amphidinium_carterae.1
MDANSSLSEFLGKSLIVSGFGRAEPFVIRSSPRWRSKVARFGQYYQKCVNNIHEILDPMPWVVLEIISLQAADKAQNSKVMVSESSHCAVLAKVRVYDSTIRNENVASSALAILVLFIPFPLRPLTLAALKARPACVPNIELSVHSWSNCWGWVTGVRTGHLFADLADKIARCLFEHVCALTTEEPSENARHAAVK